MCRTDQIPSYIYNSAYIYTHKPKIHSGARSSRPGTAPTPHTSQPCLSVKCFYKINVSNCFYFSTENSVICWGGVWEREPVQLQIHVKWTIKLHLIHTELNGVCTNCRDITVQGIFCLTGANRTYTSRLHIIHHSFGCSIWPLNVRCHSVLHADISELMWAAHKIRTGTCTRYS